MRTAPLNDFDEQHRSIWTRFKDRIGIGEFDDEADDEVEVGRRRRPITLRLSHSRTNTVSVWQSIQSLDNAQQAADGLKEGRSQIVNLEKASPEICARVIDFLNGVTYALDGYVEKVGDKVYLFTPANVVIDVANGSERTITNPFAEN
ncbi:MAG: cell division protein SepF [Armatimonadota bacterium]|nr:cell division protein SepF [Armatimonadota bacterium]